MSTTTFSAEFQTQTEKAICVRIDEEEFWIPKSTIESCDPDPDECERGDEIELEVASWWVRKEDLPV